MSSPLPLGPSTLETGSSEPRTNADKRGLLHEELTHKIITAFFEVYDELGHGFLESVYEAAMCIALRDKGLAVKRQVHLAVWFRGENVGDFKPDVLVEDLIVVELKAVRGFDPSHEAKLLNYLRATDVEVGLLMNFGPKPFFKRLVFANARKKVRVSPRLSAAPSSSDPHGVNKVAGTLS